MISIGDIVEITDGGGCYVNYPGLAADMNLTKYICGYGEGKELTGTRGIVVDIKPHSARFSKKMIAGVATRDDKHVLVDVDCLEKQIEISDNVDWGEIDEPKTIELKDCPFCESEDIKVYNCVDGMKYQGIYCGGCGCRTMLLETIDKAVERWNKRKSK